jgi:hypothetical protein
MAYPQGNDFVWNGIPARVRMPEVGGTVNGQRFPVPGGSKVLTVYVPALTGGATLKLQTLAPTELVEDTEVWADVSVFNLTDGSFVVLDGFVASTHVTIPISATGGGVLRLVATLDQSAAPVTCPIFFSRDG